MRTGGAERHWATLVPALRSRGAEAAVVCLSGEGALFGDLVRAGVPAVDLGLRRRLDPRGLRRALAFADPRPDAVVTRGVSGQVVGAAIARRAHAPHVLNEHTPLTPSGALVPARRHQRALMRLVASRVDAVIAVTERQVPALASAGYRPARVEVIANGVFGEALGEPPAPAREAGLSALCVAGLRPEKRVDVFIEAVAAARREDPAVRGAVAGEGRERARLAPLATRAEVELLGDRDDVPALIGAAGVVCLTSEAEALPMSILEAMALGRPVITTDVGGTRDAVVDGDTGFIVAPGDAAAVTRALLALAHDPERAAAMGAAGRRRQRERFDGQRMVESYEAALARIAGR